MEGKYTNHRFLIFIWNLSDQEFHMSNVTYSNIAI